MTGRDAPIRVTREKKRSAEDLGTTLNLLRRAKDTLDAAEDRISLLRVRYEQLQEIAGSELNAVHASLASAEAWAIRAEARAGRAEGAADELRKWVDQVSSRLDEVLTRSDSLNALTTRKNEPRDLSQSFRAATQRELS